jgi:hypothetical protein
MKSHGSNSLPITLRYSWHEIGARCYLIAYRGSDSALVQYLIDYVFYLSDQLDLNIRTIKNGCLYLKRFIEFLPHGELGLVSDELLRQFRDVELIATRVRRNSSGDELRAKRSVNIGIRRIYHFLLWAKDSGWLPAEKIGEFQSDVTVLRLTSKRYGAIDTPIFPLLFKRIGEASAAHGRYFATDEDKVGLEKYFRSNCTAFTYARNLLLMEVADTVGWRRGAINSLLCNQFDTGGESLKKKIGVIPARQKFGYQNSFDVGIALVNKINFFIHNNRNPFYEEMGWSQSRSEGYLFTSAKDGRPLTDQAISQIFGSAFKAIGAPRGAGMHSFRRKFADERVENEIRSRLRLGLDTSALSVAASVAILMGHSNPASVSSYVERAHSKILERGADTSDL